MKKNTHVAKMCATALLGALCYIGFMYLKINIPIGADMTAIHFGNAFCVLAALMLGGVPGGLAGAIGMGLADLMDPLYVSSFPKTFLLKFMIGLIVGLVAHKIAHIKEHTGDKKYILKWALLASLAGMAFNVIADPVVGFFYKNYILGVTYEAAKIFAAWTAVSTFINACTSILIATLLYSALADRLKHTTLFK